MAPVLDGTAVEEELPGAENRDTKVLEPELTLEVEVPLEGTCGGRGVKEGRSGNK